MTYRKTETLDVATQDLLSAAEHLENAVVLSGQSDSLEHILTWRVGSDLIVNGEEKDDADRLLAGYLLTLDVLRHHPEVMQAAAEALYAKLAEVAPRLEGHPS
jgi:hypothetical protein